MKFKIRKDQLDFLKQKNKDSDFYEIELEPVHERAMDAIAFQQEFMRGYAKGKEDAENEYYDRRIRGLR